VDFFILLGLFVVRYFRGTCSFVKMVKGHMGRESLGTPDLLYIKKPFLAKNQSRWLQQSIYFAWDWVLQLQLNSNWWNLYF